MASSRRTIGRRFRAMNAFLFILMCLAMILVMFLMLRGTTRVISADYAQLYSSKTIGILNTHLSREIGLVTKVAQSRAVIDWFADEFNEEKKRRAYEEMMGLADLLYSGNLYFGVEASKNEFSLVSSTLTFEDFKPFDTLSPDRPKDRWYFEFVKAPGEYELHVDVDKLQGRKLVWLNHKIEDAGQVLGVFCTGLLFDSVLNELFSQYDSRNVRGLVIDSRGAIQMDSELHRRAGGAGKDALLLENEARIQEEFTSPEFVTAVNSYLADIDGFFSASASPVVIPLTSGGSYSYAVIAPIESTDWSVVTFYNAASLFPFAKVRPLLLVVLVLLIVYTMVSGNLTRRMLMTPFTRLMQSLDRIQTDSSAPVIGLSRMDEFGELARTIQDMKDRLFAYNAQLQAETARAEKANAAKTVFLANMSHEMRTPLNTIIGMTQIAMENVDLDKMLESLRKVLHASSHLRSVINDILDMSKMESGNFELCRAPFDFQKMIQETVAATRPLAEEKGHAFLLDIADDIPPRLVGDSGHLSQVIMNLLSNAIKFTPDGGTITLTVQQKALESPPASAPPGLMLCISVIDTGIGISPENQSRIFKAFEQADGGISRKYGGTGVGLALSNRIVEFMGGSITLESEEGRGSCFGFAVPLEVAPLEPPPPLPASEDAAQRPFAGKRILLAEDVEINREILLTLLEDSGIEFVCAEDGRQAVAAFEKSPDAFDLIFMDIHMPEMDGFEATRCIRALDTPRAKRIPIVAMTANTFQEDVEKCHEVGMNGHIGKPLDLVIIYEHLYQFLG